MGIYEHGFIEIVNANQNNLKNVSINIPKKKISMITGVSGSGKSSLAIETIASEARRELNDTYSSYVRQYLPKYSRPDVERINNLPIAILIDQKKPSKNSRSTLGTYSDIHSYLRLLFSRIGKPFVGYSEIFSFNHPQGMCKRCEGLGYVKELDIHRLVDFDKCLNDEGVISFPAFTTGAWRWKRYAFSGLFDLDKKIRDYSDEELELFLHSPQIRLKNPPSNWPKSAKYEGIYPRMYRSIINSKEGDRHKHILDRMVTTKLCDECGGSRLNKAILSCKINDKNISDINEMSIDRLLAFVKSIKDPLVFDLCHELGNRLKALIDIGLGYLSLSRGMSTLSGGEAQRVKIAKYINSALSDIVYILDEPSVGLHPHDLESLKSSIRELANKGNTLIIIEHNQNIISIGDYIIDMGPGAGNSGGQVLFEGTYGELLNADTPTGNYINLASDLNSSPRIPRDFLSLNNIHINNLKDIDVALPYGVLTAIVGVAGAGKSSLMNYFMGHSRLDNIVYVNQRYIGTSNRSTPATYLNIMDSIRSLFSKEFGISPSYFSFNSKGGCPHCDGKGFIASEMLFMDTVVTECEECNGLRYSKEVLGYLYKGLSIAQVLDMSVREAIDFFHGEDLVKSLISMDDVGLGYLRLNQSLSTLSGGELQRLKLATHLDENSSIFVFDEPTDGLHPSDVSRLMKVFNSMVERGNTLYIISHDMNLARQCDYIIELGPYGGDKGGQIIYQGIPKGLCDCPQSVTKNYI